MPVILLINSHQCYHVVSRLVKKGCEPLACTHIATESAFGFYVAVKIFIDAAMKCFLVFEQSYAYSWKYVIHGKIENFLKTLGPKIEFICDKTLKE